MLCHSQSMGHRQRAISAVVSASRRWRPPAPASPSRPACRRRGAARHDAGASRASSCAAADMPVNADFEGGYADDPGGRRRQRATLRRDRRRRFVDRGFHRRRGQSALRIRSCAGAREGGARGDRQGRRRGDASPRAPKVSSAAVPTSPKRSGGCKAFAAAGADCLYAPGIRTREEIEAVVDAVAPKPVNFLMGWPATFRSTISPVSVCAASASAARSRAPPGPA